MPISCSLQTCKSNVTAVRNPGLSCQNCKKYWHYQCAELSADLFQQLTENKALAWTCKKCKRGSIILPAKLDSPAAKPPNTSTSSSSRGSSSNQSVKIPARQQVTIPQVAATTTTQLAEEIVELKNLLTAAVQRIDQLEAIIKSPSPPYTIPVLPQSTPEVPENSLEIRGLPTEANNSPLETAVIVAQAIGCDLDRQEVECTTSIDKTTIDIKFKNPAHKSRFLAAGKFFNRHKGRLDIIGRQFKFFVNEKLSTEKKKLLHKAKVLSSTHGYKFAWIYNGDIHIKRNELEKSIIIQHEQQLDSLFPSRILPEREPTEDQNQQNSLSNHQ